MTLDKAVRTILGERLAGAITNEQGFHWAIFAAIAQAKTSDDPQALSALRKHLEDQRAGAAS